MITKTQERVIAVLEEMQRQARADVNTADVFAEVLEEMLTSLGDFFGTEGQCDPRGDFRNGAWSMTHVEKIDAAG